MIPLNFNQFLSEIEAVLNKPRPFAHIRFGDGEGIVMGYPEYTGEKACRKRWEKWLGKNDIDMEFYAKKIREAVVEADIIGTPCLRHQKVNQDWRNVKHYMHKLGLLNGNSKTCCMNCTVELQTKGLYEKLLYGREEIFFISCRDVTNLLKNRLSIGNVEGFLLPPQNRPYMGKVHTNAHHFPDRYFDITTWIMQHDIRNKLFLIGAGGLGKVYCTLVKQNGGIALDIGSIFDGWMGLVSRSYLKNIRQFQL